MHPAANRHAYLLQALDNIRALAERANSDAIDSLLAQPPDPRHLDDHTLDFLRRAKDLIFITTQTLTTMLETEGGSSRHGSQRDEASYNAASHIAYSPSLTPNHPAHLDAAEAWRRAHLHLPYRDDAPVLIHIQEFAEGYQAIPILVPIPEPPSMPTIETATTLVIDKTTGTVTRWPLLRLDALARQYRRYMNQEPMTFDNRPA